MRICKTTKIKAENVYFTFKHKDEIRNTLLPTSQIVHHQVDYYVVSEVPKEKLENYKNYPQFRIAVNGGFSYMTGKVSDKVPSDFRDYIKELKSGYHNGGEASFFFSESLGFGARYNVFKSSFSLDQIYVEDVDGNITYGKMSDAIKISFIGPSFSVRALNYNKKNAFIFSMSIGYMDYVNDKVMIKSFKMAGMQSVSALILVMILACQKTLLWAFKFHYSLERFQNMTLTMALINKHSNCKRENTRI